MHLDPEIIESLRALDEGDTPAFLYDLIDTYLQDSPAKLEAIEKARRAGDAASLGRAAHALKGSSGNMGAMALFSICDALHRAAKASDFAAAESVSGSLRLEYLEVERELAALRGRQVDG